MKKEKVYFVLDIETKYKDEQLPKESIEEVAKRVKALIKGNDYTPKQATQLAILTNPNYSDIMCIGFDVLDEKLQSKTNLIRLTQLFLICIFS